MFDPALGHDYVIWSEGALETVFGCSKCCSTAHLAARGLRDPCPGQPTSSSQRSWWKRMCETGFHRHRGERVGRPRPLSQYLREETEKQAAYLDESSGCDADA